MPKHVLVPIDGSEKSSRALEYALEEYPDSRITALTVLDPADFYTGTGMEGGAMGNYEQLRAAHEERGESILEEAAELARSMGQEIETEHVVGGVGRSILTYSEEEDVDHIVIGSHGRTGARRILLGSVAEKVARRSLVPVTIVR